MQDRLIRFQFLAIRVDGKPAIPPRPRFKLLAWRVDTNSVILGQLEFQFLAIRVDGKAAILAQPGTFKIRYIAFLS